MSKNAVEEAKLGQLHEKVYNTYMKLCDDPEDAEGTPLLSPKELLTALSGAAKFLNDNHIKAPRFVDDEAGLDAVLERTKKKRSFGNVIDMQEKKQQQTG